jgi:hypothetical protein
MNPGAATAGTCTKDLWSLLRSFNPAMASSNDSGLCSGSWPGCLSVSRTRFRRLGQSRILEAQSALWGLAGIAVRFARLRVNGSWLRVSEIVLGCSVAVAASGLATGIMHPVLMR